MAASTYVQETVIAAAGVVLAASQLLQGFDLVTVIAFVAGTYIVWFAGLLKEPRGELGPAGGYRDEHERAFEGGIRTRETPDRQCARPEGRGRYRLRLH